MASDPEVGIALMADDITGERLTLSRLRCDEAAEMLGVWMAPDGNRTKVVAELKASAVEWGGKISQGNTSRREAWTALQSNISARLKYPLPACTLTKKECKSIMYPALKSALPKSGIAACIAGKVRDGPSISGGAGALSLYHYMGTSRTALLAEQLYRDTPLGFEMKTCIEDLVVDTGRYGLLWNMPFPIISKYIDKHSWVYSVIHYNHNYDIVMAAPHAELKGLRMNDESIMTAAGNYYESTTKLKAINRVRQGHKCHSLSEICSANGREIDVRYTRKTLCGALRNGHNWPTKTKITVKDYRLWRNFLDHLCGERDLILRQPLGDWNLQTQAEWLSQWDWFVDRNTRLLYHQPVLHTWVVHSNRNNSHYSYDLHSTPCVSAPDGELLRATVSHLRCTILLRNTSPRGSRTVNEDDSMTFDVIELEKPKLDWFHTYISSSTSTASLYAHIISNTALAVSDGSYYPHEKVGACAWTISTPDGKEWIKGGGVIPGEHTDQNSYRAELGGQLGIAVFIESIVMPEGDYHMTTVCDGLAALNNVGIDKEYIRCSLKHVDMISMITELWSLSSFTPI